MDRKKPIKKRIDGDLTNSKFTDDINFIKIKDLFEKLKVKYNVSISDLINKIEKKEILIPCEIFNKKLSSLETICKYLRENLNLTNKEISILINRDERTIWQAYDSSKKKLSNKFIIKFSKYYLPISILNNRNYSVLESIVKYLRENLNLRYHDIANLLERNDRTIWTVYQRVKKKNVV